MQVQWLVAFGVAGLLSAQTQFLPDRLLFQPGLRSPGILFDADGDGDLDRFVAGSESVLQRNLGAGRFETSVLPHAAFANAAAAGDLDGDSDRDLVLSGYAGSTLLFNDGTGTFVRANGATASGAPTSVAVFDLDNDGDLDIYEGHTSVVFDCGGFSNCALADRCFRNDGLGIWTAVAVPGVAARAAAVVAADFNGDGRTDIAVANTSPAEVRLLPNTGVAGGGFGLSTMPAATPVVALAAADFDQDGRLDLAAATQGGVELFRNQGLMVFTRMLLPPPATTTSGATAGDLDGDGDADLVVTQASSFATHALDRCQVLRNDGGAGFTDASATLGAELAGSMRAPSLFDLDGDGDLDLAVQRLAVSGSANVHTYVNDGAGRFLDLERIERRTFLPHAATGDVDNDGDADVVSVVYAYPAVPLRYLELRRNDGTGSLQVQSIPLVFASGGTVTLVDVDSDRDLDLYYVESQQHHLLINDGAGSFTDETVLRLTTASSAAALCAHGDLDGDGDEDLLLGGNAVPLQIARNLGNGVFAAVPAALPGFPTALDAQFADFDLDGDLDLVTADSVFMRLFDNDGSSLFTEVTSRIAGDRSGVRGLTLRDFDHDGRVDVIAHAALPRYFAGTVGGGLAADALRSLPVYYAPMLPVDVDLDGDDDLVAGSASGTVTLRNDGSGMFAVGPSEAVTGSVWPVDLDGDGDQDLLGGESLVPNRHRQLHVAAPPLLGMPLQLEVHAPGRPAPTPVALAYDLARLPAPFVVPGIGRLWLDPTTALFDVLTVVPTGGVASLAPVLPRLPTLVGLTLFVQPVFVEGVSPPHLVIGNLLLLPLRV